MTTTFGGNEPRVPCILGIDPGDPDAVPVLMEIHSSGEPVEITGLKPGVHYHILSARGIRGGTL
jgi:hypothetical protein